MIYGYRRPPYGVRGIVSEDGLTWDVKDEFVIREGGVPGNAGAGAPAPGGRSPRGGIDWRNPGIYQHIGYPSVAEAPDGTVVASYHEWDDRDDPLQYVLCTRFRV